MQTCNNICMLLLSLGFNYYDNWNIADAINMLSSWQLSVGGQHEPAHTRRERTIKNDNLFHTSRFIWLFLELQKCSVYDRAL